MLIRIFFHKIISLQVASQHRLFASNTTTAGILQACVPVVNKLAFVKHVLLCP